MSFSQTIQDAATWFSWSGLALAIITILFFIFNWGGKYRLVGATIFTLLLSISCWAFSESYRPPLNVEGAKYAPVVYDNGSDLVVAQASEDFPEEAIEPTLQQIAGNLKGGGGNRSVVHVRIRKLEPVAEGVSKPVILGEVLLDVVTGTTSPLPSLEPKEIYEPELSSEPNINIENAIDDSLEIIPRSQTSSQLDLNN